MDATIGHSHESLLHIDGIFCTRLHDRLHMNARDIDRGGTDAIAFHGPNSQQCWLAIPIGSWTDRSVACVGATTRRYRPIRPSILIVCCHMSSFDRSILIWCLKNIKNICNFYFYITYFLCLMKYVIFYLLFINYVVCIGFYKLYNFYLLNCILGWIFIPIIFNKSM